jgi:hypothetical protein
MNDCDVEKAAGRFAEVVDRLWPEHGEGEFDVAARESPWLEPPIIGAAPDCAFFRFAVAVHPKEGYWDGPLLDGDEKHRRHLKIALDMGAVLPGAWNYLHYLKLLPYWEVALGEQLRARWPCLEVDSMTAATLRVRDLDFDGVVRRTAKAIKGAA